MRPLATIRLRLFVRRTRWAMALMVAWFTLGALLFRFVDHLPLDEAIVNALYLGRDRGWLWDLYSFWGQCVLFGLVVSVFLLQAVQQYNPQEACRMLAREMRDHTVVIGYTHLGARIVDHLRRIGQRWVVIDKDPTAVDHLVRAGEPVIVDNAREPGALEEAGVTRARAVVVASNNLETALVVTKRARERNRGARIVVRCYQDDFVEILESLGADQVISSSRSAFRELEDVLGPPPREAPAPAKADQR